MVVRDEENRHIYVQCVLRNDTTKKGRLKKLDRVYNKRHPCPYDKNMWSNWATHVLKQHRDEEEVRKINDIQIKEDDTELIKSEKTKLRKKLCSILRRKAENQHNVKVLQSGKGQLFLARRFEKGNVFRITDFGPCPLCYEWCRLTGLYRHAKICPMNEKQNKDTKGSLLTQSAVLAERICARASKDLVGNVLPIMLNDEVGTLAKSDPLIVTLGNQWYLKNRGNDINRAYYTSSAMRLGAKLLLNLRKVKPLAKQDFMSYLKAEHFDSIVEATIQCCLPDFDDLEDLKSPSNAIKLGYEIKHLLAAKKGYAIRSGNKGWKEECSDVLELMNAEWSTKVTKLARVTLNERRFNQAKALPDPEDVRKLSKYLQDELSQANLKDNSRENRQKVAQLTQAYLISYNRRRSGEVQAMK